VTRTGGATDLKIPAIIVAPRGLTMGAVKG
jgi:hypothetical protein